MLASIRLSTPADRDAILAFIERSGFNPRDAVTWDGLNMQAMTAWENDALIGAIPFEPRQLRISADRTIQTIHETVVAVDPAHRGSGIGSKMQSAIFEQRPANAELVTVFREEPDSLAYRWYQHNGFAPVMNIHSWFCDQPVSTGETPRLWEASDPAAPWSLFESSSPPGRISRDLRPWLAVHPYRKRYTFWIIEGQPGSAALIGVGTMHSQTERVDVLDWIAPDIHAAGSLLRSICNTAAMREWKPVRVPLASNDPRTEIVRSHGFESRWSFDMLARTLNPALKLDSTAWRYAGIDYI